MKKIQLKDFRKSRNFMKEFGEFLIKRKSGEEIKVLFDKEDSKKVQKYEWQYHLRGAVYPMMRGKKYLFLHKFVLGDKIQNPAKDYVFFINKNPFDCRKENLSIGKDVRENLYLHRRRKQLKIKKNGNIEGIYFNPWKQYWLAYIKLNKRQYSQSFSIGRFKEDAKEKAIQCRKNFLFLSCYDLLEYFVDRKYRAKEQRIKSLKETYFKKYPCNYSQDAKIYCKIHKYKNSYDICIWYDRARFQKRFSFKRYGINGSKTKSSDFKNKILNLPYDKVVEFINRIRKKTYLNENELYCRVYHRNKEKWNERYVCIIRFNNLTHGKTFPTYQQNALENAYKYKEKFDNYTNEQIIDFFNKRNEILQNRGKSRELTEKEYSEVINLIPTLEELINKRVNKWIPNGMLSFGDFRQNCLIEFVNKKYSQFKNRWGGHPEESQILEKWFTKYLTFRIKAIRSKIFDYSRTRKSLTSANEESARWKGNIKNKEESQITILSTLENPAPSEIDFDSSVKQLDKLVEIEFTKDEFEIYQQMKNNEKFTHPQTGQIRQKLLEIIRENDLVLI